VSLRNTDAEIDRSRVALRIESLVPLAMRDVSRDEFLRRLASGEGDEAMRARFDAARRRGLVLRYVATVRADGVRVALSEVSPSSGVGAVQAGDNVIVFASQWYSTGRGLVVSGPGAGRELTAAAVIAEVCRLA
jgi:homoserine dehydrogenase